MLSESVRAQDLVCRHGGEEFVIALPGCATGSALQILDAVRARLDAAITVAGLPKFTVSFGIIDAGDKEDLSSLLSRADAALYQAKRDGRDRVVIHDPAGNAVPATTGPRPPRGLDSRSPPPTEESSLITSSCRVGVLASKAEPIAGPSTWCWLPTPT